MNRPYLNAGIAELTDLFKGNNDSPSILEQLFEELVERRSKGARALLAQVSGRLAELEADGDDRNLPAAGPPGPPIAFPNELFPRDVESLGPHPDDQQRPKRLTLIRPPGTPGLPDVWQRPLKRDISLNVGKDADLPDRFVAALRALISEMKRTGSGQKRYELERGGRVDSAGDEFIYAFPFTDEAELFEEAQVELQIAGRRVAGSIVSISADRIVVALKEDLGEELTHAVLLIDATALIEALAEKIEQAKKGELTLNRALADAVAGNRPAPDAPPEIRGGTPKLNKEQRAAYDRARVASVTWIMGPPGTGKTKTLGEIGANAVSSSAQTRTKPSTNCSLRCARRSRSSTRRCRKAK